MPFLLLEYDNHVPMHMHANDLRARISSSFQNLMHEEIEISRAVSISRGGRVITSIIHLGAWKVVAWWVSQSTPVISVQVPFPWTRRFK